MRTHTLEIENDLSELHRIHDCLERLGEEWNIPPKPVFDIALTVEELVSNVINYGYEDTGNLIVLRFSLDGDVLSVLIEDEGKAFNPLDMPSPDIHAPVEERKIGGLGIHLAKTLMDSFSYERNGDRNRVTVTRRISRIK
ncbi:ATP-binding protein [bacterium]|nr:ATP-binding protein [bacterium]